MGDGSPRPRRAAAFHPDWKLMDALPTPAKTLRMARRIAMNVGIHYVYTGNVHDPVDQSTHCHACSAVLIGRDQYAVTAWNSTRETVARNGAPAVGGEPSQAVAQGYVVHSPGRR